MKEIVVNQLIFLIILKKFGESFHWKCHFSRRDDISPLLSKGLSGAAIKTKILESQIKAEDTVKTKKAFHSLGDAQKTFC